MQSVEDKIREKANIEFGTDVIDIIRPKKAYRLPHDHRQYREYSIIIKSGKNRGMYDILVDDKDDLYSGFGQAGEAAFS